MRSMFLILLGILVTGTGYSDEQTARFGRVSKIEGQLLLLRYGLTEWEDAAVNMVLSEGDRAYTDKESYAEIQFDNGTIVRMNRGTDLEIIDLTRDTESGEEITSAYVAEGGVNVTVPRYHKRGRAFDVETPQGLVSIEEKSSARIDVSKDNATAALLEGRANVVGEKGDRTLIAGEQTSIRQGEKPEHPSEFSMMDTDPFDDWCRETRETRGGRSRRYVSEDVVLGVDDLDDHGRWVYVRHHGWCWRPSVYRGWRPYFHGHWVHRRRGWVWVSYEPWGWAPYHYGRWAYNWPYGWVWIPGRRWGPCWVVWHECPGSIGWAPMGPCGGPWFSCSVHYVFVNKWVYVSRHEFSHYKYKHHPGKSYRGRKPYRYAFKTPKNAGKKWQKTAPKVVPGYAKGTKLPGKKTPTPSHGKRIGLPSQISKPIPVKKPGSSKFSRTPAPSTGTKMTPRPAVGKAVPAKRATSTETKRVPVPSNRKREVKPAVPGKGTTVKPATPKASGKYPSRKKPADEYKSGSNSGTTWRSPAKPKQDSQKRSKKTEYKKSSGKQDEANYRTVKQTSVSSRISTSKFSSQTPKSRSSAVRKVSAKQKS
jgi:hypothetical protein